ncbi:hypothetical protein Ddc_15405 [Ditylenchus destructor]|nr:hypothetical protein Ddc_15405 [Ditylenchus destructor]
MLSPGRTSIILNARTLLLNRRYFSSIAVTSRYNAFGLHKNDFLRSNVDNSPQAFLCMQQRGLRTKEKTSDEKPSNSSSDGSKPDFERLKILTQKIGDIMTNPQQFRSFKDFRNALFTAYREFAGTNRFLLITADVYEKLIPEEPKKVSYYLVVVIIFYLTLAYAVYLAYKLVRRIWSLLKNALSPPAIESDLEKKELETGNEFDLNALLQTESDSGKHQSYSEFK